MNEENNVETKALINWGVKHKDDVEKGHVNDEYQLFKVMDYDYNHQQLHSSKLNEYLILKEKYKNGK